MTVLEGIELNLLRRARSLTKRTVVRVWDEKAIAGDVKSGCSCNSRTLKVLENTLSIRFHSFLYMVIIIIFLVLGGQTHILYFKMIVRKTNTG